VPVVVLSWTDGVVVVEVKATLEQDFKEADALLDQEPQASKSTAEGKFTVNVNGKEIPVTINKVDERSGEKLVYVNIAPFEANFEKDKNFYVGKEGKGGIGKRYEQFEDFIKTADSVEAPEVGIDEKGHVQFGNGRHRYAYFRDQGLTRVPMAMSAESLANAKKFGYVGEEKQSSKATAEQKKSAEAVANSFTGGEVAWQEGDLALIRVFSALSGDPIYIPSKGTRYVS
jgi:hypothetical protein